LYLAKSQSIVVCSNGCTGYLLGADGRLLKTFNSDNSRDCFVSVTASSSGNLIYFVSENGNLHCFSSASGDLLHIIHGIDGEVTCLSHHPRKSVVGVSSTSGILSIFSI
jgi:WD40 repeat protein